MHAWIPVPQTDQWHEELALEQLNYTLKQTPRKRLAGVTTAAITAAMVTIATATAALTHELSLKHHY